MHTHQNARIHNRDEVCVSDVIENVSPPRPVDTANENVAIKRTPEGFRFEDSLRHSDNVEFLARSVLAKALVQDGDLEPAYVSLRCINEPVQVVVFNLVEVEKKEVLEARARERFSDKSSRTSGTDNANP